MDFDLAPEHDERRRSVREWLRTHPDPTGREVADAGFVVPHWPRPWGLDADPMMQLIIDDELDRAGVRRPIGIGLGWAAPTILTAGTPAQQQRFLPAILAGEEHWCQLFSEPDAGSDLAALSTTAERDGDEYVVNGSKIWTTGAHHSAYGVLLARTDPDAPKHQGISYFVCPMDAPGLTITPVVDMTTAHSFNQVFFDNVRLPSAMRIGDEGDGWRLARVTLANERVVLSSAGSLWGSGPSADDLLSLLRQSEGALPRVLRQRAVRLYIESRILQLNRFRSLSARLLGRTPGPEASIQKIMSDEHGQHVMALAKDVAGAAGMLVGSGPIGELPQSNRPLGPTANDLDSLSGVDAVWHYGFMFSPALTIGGGTFAIQRNIVAELVLGLPREPRPAA